jgi:hypothetical protein
MLQTNSHTFPTNSWIYKIPKGKESDRYDLCKDLWITEDRLTTEKDLPEQKELARLTDPTWKFLYISGEKYLQTLWNEIPSEIEGLQYLNLTQDTIWNTAKTREMDRPLTQAESRTVQEGQS